MATIEKRESGYRVKIRKGGVSRSASFRTKAQAQAWAAQQETEIMAGRLGQAPDRSFGDLIERYIKEIVPTKRGARVEEIRLRRILVLGNDGVPTVSKDGTPREVDPLALVRLPDLVPDHFGQWRDRRLKQVSSASVLREWATLSSACNTAVKEWRWLQTNPMSDARRPAAGDARTRRVTPDDIDRLMLATGYHDGELLLTMQRCGAALLFAIETAMRAGEIVGLTWDNVDLSRQVAHLPKTKNGYARDVPLSKEALRILAQLPKRDDGGCFGLASATLDALFRKAKARAMINDLHFHDSRREALSRLAKKVDVLTLAKISGHRDLRILSNVYYQTDMAEVAASLG